MKQQKKKSDFRISFTYIWIGYGVDSGNSHLILTWIHLVPLYMHARAIAQRQLLIFVCTFIWFFTPQSVHTIRRADCVQLMTRVCVSLRGYAVSSNGLWDFLSLSLSLLNLQNETVVHSFECIKLIVPKWMCNFHISMHSKPSEIMLEISKIQKPNKKTIERSVCKWKKKTWKRFSGFLFFFLLFLGERWKKGRSKRK